MRTKILLLCILFSLCGYSQSYFSNYYDFTGAGDTDFIGMSLVDQDTLYFLSREICGGGECSSVVAMDSLGEIHYQRKFDWILPNPRHGFTQDGDTLLVLDGTCCNAQAYYQLLLLDKQLDSLTTYRFYPEEEMVFMADAAITVFGDYYILMGWSQSADDEDYWPEQMLWVNKHTMEVDTNIAFSDNDFEGIWDSGFTDGADRFYAYFNVDQSPTNARTARGFVGFNQDMEEVFYYVDLNSSTNSTHFNTNLLLSSGNLIFEQTADVGSYINITCIDTMGNIVWENEEILERFSNGIQIKDFIETQDGNIVFCGQTRWFLGFEGEPPLVFTDEFLEMYPDYKSGMIGKINGTTGELMWYHRLVELQDDGGVKENFVRKISELSDGSLMGVGGLVIRAGGGPTTSYDSWVFRMPASGCRPEYECITESWLSSTESEPSEELASAFKIYPNPASEVLTVEIATQGVLRYQLDLYDLQGKKWKRWDINSRRSSLDITALPTGSYIYRLRDREGRRSMGRVVKL